MASGRDFGSIGIFGSSVGELWRLRWERTRFWCNCVWLRVALGWF